MIRGLNRQGVALAACLYLCGCNQSPAPKEQAAARPADSKPSPTEIRIEALEKRYAVVRAKLRGDRPHDDWLKLSNDKEVLEKELRRLDPFPGFTIEREDKLDQAALRQQDIEKANLLLNEPIGRSQ